MVFVKATRDNCIIFQKIVIAVQKQADAAFQAPNLVCNLCKRAMDELGPLCRGKDFVSFLVFVKCSLIRNSRKIFKISFSLVFIA